MLVLQQDLLGLIGIHNIVGIYFEKGDVLDKDISINLVLVIFLVSGAEFFVEMLMEGEDGFDSGE